MANTLESLEQENAQLRARNDQLLRENTRLKNLLQGNSSKEPQSIPLDLLHQYVNEFIIFCETEKGLSSNTLESYRRNITLYLGYLQENGLGHNMSSVSLYVEYLQANKKPRSVKCKISALKMFHTFLIERGISTEPFIRIRMDVVAIDPLSEPEILTREEVEEILKCAYAQVDLKKTDRCYNGMVRALRDVAILELLVSAGLRPAELIALCPDDVDIDAGRLRIDRGGAQERVLCVEKRVRLALSKYANLWSEDIRKIGFFFVKTKGSCLTDDIVRRIVKKYAELAGIKQKVTPQMLRATFAAVSLELGMSLDEVQFVLGHADANTTDKYRRLNKPASRPAIRVWRVWSPATIK